MTASDGPIGVPVPEEYMGAFVAEVFEDPERTTTWREAVAALVAPADRDAWEALSPIEQVIVVLDTAAEYDQTALRRFEEIPDDGYASEETIRETYEEAKRNRRNADMLRNAVADAYSRDVIDDNALVEAVDRHGFDSETIAAREQQLESVADAYGLEFRPYGGTLIEPAEEKDPDRSASPTFGIESG